MKTPQAWSSSSKVMAKDSNTSVLADSDFETPSNYTPFKAPKVIDAASMDMGESIAGSGKCPACRVKMRTLNKAQFPMQICVGCRISLPIKDEKENN